MNQYEDHNHWNRLLNEFSDRNRGRRARLETFDRDGVREEMQEAVFERIAIDGPEADGRQQVGGARVLIQRQDKSSADPELLETIIERVRRLAPQYDNDGSEQALEIEDDRRVLTILRFESNIDGAS